MCTYVVVLPVTKHVCKQGVCLNVEEVAHRPNFRTKAQNLIVTHNRQSGTNLEENVRRVCDHMVLITRRFRVHKVRVQSNDAVLPAT